MTGSESGSKQLDDFLIANLKDAVDRMRYTYKTQEKAASRFELYEKRRRWALLVLTALAAGSFITAIFALTGYEEVGAVIVGLVATLATLTSFLGDFLDFARHQQEHHVAAVKVRNVFVLYESLLSDYLAGAVTATEARSERDRLQDLTTQLLQDIPRTTRADYEKADKSIRSDEKTSAEQEKLELRIRSQDEGISCQENEHD